MRVLLLCHSFNSLAQRIFVELSRRSHELSVELDINEHVTREAVALFEPDLIVAPFLKRAIAEDVWRRVPCFIVHPGIKGDRGPSSLDWAIVEGEREWGVVVLQANAEMDAGDIWATAAFSMRAGPKSSLYRREVTEAAVRGVLRAVERYESGTHTPEPQSPNDPSVRGRARRRMRQVDRRIDWATDATETVLRKVWAADGSPGVLDTICGKQLYLFGAHREDQLVGEPAKLLAVRHGAVCRATVDGAVWITHMKPRAMAGGERTFKLPATKALGELVQGLPELALPVRHDASARPTYQDITYDETGDVGTLRFAPYNGAMGVRFCERLLQAYRYARSRPTRVIVLMGGPDFWSNGIDLNLIEAAESPADESWRSIHAIDDLALAILTDEQHLTLAAMQGNAAAGGVFLALAADRVVARSGVVLNPHYKSMGNLYGSEYWTYLLPKRVGDEAARSITQNRLPLGAPEACAVGLIDAHYGRDTEDFLRQTRALAEEVAASTHFSRMLAHKRQHRRSDEAAKPLCAYREAELREMHRNFFGFDPSYHVARYNFVRKVPKSHSPRYLARHR